MYIKIQQFTPTGNSESHINITACLWIVEETGVHGENPCKDEHNMKMPLGPVLYTAH